MANRTGAHVWYGVVRGKTTDNFAPRTFATPQVTDAFVTLFKHTPDEIALKVDAFITGGLPGVLRKSGQNRITRVRSEIRDLVLNGFREFDLYVLVLTG